MMGTFLYEGDDGIGGDWSGGVEDPTYYEPSFSENPTGASFFLQPIDARISQFENFLQSDEAKQFSPEQLKQLENLVVGGIDPSQMQDLIDQAEGDVKPGGIMSGNPFGTQTGGTKGQSLLDKLLSNKGLLQAGLGGLGALAAYKSAKDAQKQAAGATLGKNAPVTATRSAFKGTKYSAEGGGIGSLDMAQGGRALPPRYLDGHSDGMADKVPANIDGKRPAALSDGEFVIPADVVSHLGNGNSNAGAKRLYEMMDQIRSARTGNHKQGKQINPAKFLPR
jgi:hypothetical protein